MMNVRGLGIAGLRQESVIGTGGFGVVHRAWDETFERWVAVKVVHDGGEDGLRRFHREARILGRLADHPNVITPFHAGSTETGRWYLVMEYVPGGSLADLIDDRGRLGWREAVALLLPVCDALIHAHDRGVVHRDVKPANILLAATGPKLSDFGIAAFGEVTAGHPAFSLAYSPPETFLDGRDGRDERSDVYSMAATIHATVTGRAPYQVDGTDSHSAQMVRILQHPVPATAVGPSEFRRLLRRAMAKVPSERPGTMAELAGGLRALLGRPAIGTGTGTVVLPPVVVDGSDRPATGPDRGDTTSTRNRSCLAPVDRDTITGPGGDRGDAGVRTGRGGGHRAVTRVDRRPRDDFGDHRAAVRALALVGGGLTASGGDDGTVRLWPAEDRSVDPLVIDCRCERVRAVTGLGRQRVACAADSRVRVLDLGGPAEPLVVFRHQRGPVRAVAALDGERLVSAGDDGDVAIWSIEDPYRAQSRFAGHTTAVVSLVVLDDGRVASADRDGGILIWDPERPTRAPAELSGHRGPVRALALGVDGRLVSGGDDGSVRVWDPTGRRPALVLGIHRRRQVAAVLALPARGWLSAGRDGTVVHWPEPGSSAAPVELVAAGRPVLSLAPTPSGRVALGGRDGVVRFLTAPGA